MSLDTAKLEKVRELSGGIVQARCPACAEGGHDRTGEHLRIYPDGRFGCCVHPKDGEHRKRIFALAGLRGKSAFPPSGTFTLRLKMPSAMPETRSVKSALTNFDAGMPKADKTEPGNGVPVSVIAPVDDFGTLGTPIFNPHAYVRKDSTHVPVYMCKDSWNAVPSVPNIPDDPKDEESTPPAATSERLPFLTLGGSLSIPFDSPERYHWWHGGQSVAATLVEVRVGPVTRKETAG
jgi:hypothetical protein